jgi:hypothetical protein
MQNITLELNIGNSLHSRGMGGCFSLTNELFLYFKSIKLDYTEVYSPLVSFALHFRIPEFPELLENALFAAPGCPWPEIQGNYPYPHFFIKGSHTLDVSEVEYDPKFLHISRNEIYILVVVFDFEEEEVIPLLHFYQVLLLLSEKILEMARQYGTVAYYQKVEPQHYNPNWEQEMERLIGLLRERIAVERERED